MFFITPCCTLVSIDRLSISISSVPSIPYTPTIHVLVPLPLCLYLLIIRILPLSLAIALVSLLIRYMEEFIEAETLCIDGTRSGKDKNIIQEATKRSADEW